MIQDQPLFGLGFRAKHYDELLAAGPKDVNFVEIMTENYLHHCRAKKTFLDDFAARWTLSLHGVGLSIGGPDPLNRNYLESLRLLVKRLSPKFVTDHLCWTSFEGHNSHDLLPLPYTDEALRHIIARVQYVQDLIGQRLYLENPSAYTAFAASSLEEAEFLAALTKESGCGILLDVNNLHVVHTNLGTNPLTYLAKLDASSIGYLHMAGHTVQGNILIDTHDQPITETVASLYELVVGRVPHIPTLLEWDGEVPPYQTLIAHLDDLKKRHQRSLDAPRYDNIIMSPRLEEARPQTNLRTQTESLKEIQKHFFGLMTSVKPPDLSQKKLNSILDPTVPVPSTLGFKVYRDAYWVRLSKVVRGTYPCLLSLLGPKHFTEIVREYLAAYPPCEPDIKFAGQYLATFLAKHPFLDIVDVPSQVLADIAALEWAKYDALDDLDSPSVMPSICLSNVTAEAWPHVTVEFNAQIRVVRSDWAIGRVLEEFARGLKPAKPTPQKSAYFVTKKDDDVQVSSPDWLEYQLFEKLRNGHPFEEALLLCHGGSLTEDDVFQGVTWLSEWCSSGLVTDLHHH